MQIPTLIDNWNLHKTTQTDIVGICTNKINCLITGLDISMQRKGSKYLCFAGLKYYREKEINKYKELENKYLTDKMRLRDWEEQLYYIAHNIRNAKTNLIHNRKSFEQRNYPQNQLQFSFQF